jgi:hypothetical protein
MDVIGLIMLPTTRVAFSDSNGNFNESFGLNMDTLAEALCCCVCERACMSVCVLAHMCVSGFSRKPVN